MQRMCSLSPFPVVIGHRLLISLWNLKVGLNGFHKKSCVVFNTLLVAIFHLFEDGIAEGMALLK